MNKNLQLKNKRLLICCLILCSQSLMAQTIEKWFVNMPDVLNPTLTKQNRMELLEYHKAGQGDSIANRFGHLAYIMSFDTLKNEITVKNTPSSLFEMKILNLEDSKHAIGIIRTVCALVCLSAIEFYDTAWNSIPIQFKMPKAIEWVDEKNIPADKIDTNWVKNLMKISFITLKFSGENQLIIAKNSTLDFLSEEARKVIAPYISDKTITFELKGRTWQHKQ